MHRLYSLVILLCCGFGTTIAAAAEERHDRVNAVEAGQTLILATSGRAALAGLVFPDPDRADAWFAAHLLQKEITYTADESDRYGRLLVESDTQEAILRDGAALLFSATKPPAEWLAADAQANATRRGLWADPDFVLTPEYAARHMQEFHVIEGSITRIYEDKRATYLNFGADWHTDFSVKIPARNRRSFKKILANLHEGTQVRVRGMIYEENGPMIRLSRPEQLEVL